MSFNLIEQGLNKTKDVTSWSSFLIEYNHKAHPNEYVCYDMKFSTGKLLKDTISDMCATYLNVVNKYEKKVIDYTGYNPKNVVDKIGTDNVLIKDCWKSLIDHINVSDDTTSFKNIKATAYIFVGTYKTDSGEFKNLYLLTRKNPLYTYKKNRSAIFTSQHNTISEADEPLVQFNKCFDALIYNNILYMINSNCESIFNMEYSHRKICQKCLSELEKSNIIEDITVYKNYATVGQVPKKFITYDSVIVNKLKLPKWQKQLSKDLKIPLNTKTNQFDLSNETNAKIFTLAICGKTKLNMFDDGICEVHSSTPLNL